MMLRNLVSFFLFPILLNISGTKCSKSASEVDPEIDYENLQQGFMKMLTHLEAHNFKQKYELGKLAVHMINHLHKQNLLTPETGGTGVDPSPRRNEIDSNPEASYETAAGLYKTFLSRGFSAIEGDLRSALARKAGYIIDKLLYMAIRNQNVELVRHLKEASGGLIQRTYDVYKFTLDNLVEENTEESEAIVEILCQPQFDLLPSNTFRDRLNLQFAYKMVFKYITDNNFPMLKHALDLGLDPNYEFPSHGSLLAVSVMFRCTKCVDILLKKGARVDITIKYSTPIYLDAIDKTESVNGWSPLMLAVADGQIRIIQRLINTGKANVTKIVAGREQERLHARAVAREIVHNNSRQVILNMLKITNNELASLTDQVRGKTFVQSVSNLNFETVDKFLLMKSNVSINTENIRIDNPRMEKILEKEFIDFD